MPDDPEVPLVPDDEPLAPELDPDAPDDAPLDEPDPDAPLVDVPRSGSGSAPNCDVPGPPKSSVDFAPPQAARTVTRPPRNQVFAGELMRPRL